MKKLFLICLFIPFFLFAQTIDLSKFLAKYSDKIKIGSSVEEVKKILKNPDAIENGFPDSQDLIIYSFPEQKGQLNYTTWIYRLPITKIKSKSDNDIYCFLNGKKVDYHIFKEYENSDLICIYKDEIIFKAIANSYLTLKDTNLEIVHKSDQAIIDFSNNSTYTFLPFICVIFEKGTQSVATTKIFLKIL